jgi:cystathionine gamma-synthase
LGAIYAALRFMRPKRIVKDKCYHGTNRIVEQFFVTNGVPCVDLATPLQAGDVVVLESPNNPRCRCFDLRAWSAACKRAGAKLMVDSTFASPVLQNPLLLGADVCVHSATKFIGGHSDVLAGVCILPSASVAEKMRAERSVMGNTLGNLECWLLLRSIRTLFVRVQRQSASAVTLATWLASQPIVTKVWHTSRPDHPDHAIASAQMKGHPGVLAIELPTADAARRLVTLTHIWADCTSLGGVESLIDYRLRWDATESPTIVRLSVGLEEPADLIADLAQAFKQLQHGSAKL